MLFAVMIRQYIALVYFIIVVSLPSQENVAVHGFVAKNILRVQIHPPPLLSSTSTSTSTSSLRSSKSNHNLRPLQKQGKGEYENNSQRQSQSRKENNNDTNTVRIRLNKVFKATHSRREADTLIANGRVSVNGQRIVSKGGHYVIPHVDIVSLDGVVLKGWEDMNAVEKDVSIDKGNANRTRNKNNKTNMRNNNISNSQNLERQGNGGRMTKSHFQYVKFYKPVGVTCTTDSKVRGNIIDSIQRSGYSSPHRIYPVGRLDKDTSGLILLTSDGRVPNAVLRGINKQPKIYKVEVDIPIRDRDIQRLRDGIIITTVAQRDNKAKKLTQRTKPCKVKRLGHKVVQMTLMEGRNRQIRKMMGALGFTVVKLHRTDFMNIRLSYDNDGYGYGGNNVRERRNENLDSNRMGPSSSNLIRPGDWSFLNDYEMRLVDDALKSSSVNQSIANEE